MRMEKPLQFTSCSSSFSSVFLFILLLLSSLCPLLFLYFSLFLKDCIQLCTVCALLFQPVTGEEVEKARISPLALSLIQPPDPDSLKGLSVQEQRALMADWAQKQLQASSSIYQPSATQDRQQVNQTKGIGMTASGFIITATPAANPPRLYLLFTFPG